MASKFSSPFMAKSPLHGAYTSATGQGSTYVSNREAFQKLQDDIVEGAKEADKIFTDPKNQAERLQKRIDRREERADDKGMGGQQIADVSKALTRISVDPIETKRDKFDKKTQELRERKKGFDKEIEKQKKEKRSQNFLTAAEKTEIVKQHFLGEEGKEEDWNALTPKQKKEVVLDYRTYYGFN
jgi:hypothetical protein